jgi:hypothetical protein
MGQCISSLEENNCQLKLLYPAKLAFIIIKEIKTFHDKKKKLKQFMNTKSPMQKILKFYTEIKTNATMKI